MTEEKKQIIDTTHDYMSLIYSHVIKKEDDKDIYEIVKEDYAKMKQDNNDFDTDSWLDIYYCDMEKEKKNKILTKYGISNLLVNLEKIAGDSCFRSFKDFLADGGNDGDFTLDLIIMYIIREEIIGEEEE